MRKGRDGGEKKNEMKKKIMAEIVATTSLPVDRLTAINCNDAARAPEPYTENNVLMGGLMIFVFKPFKLIER